MKKLAGRRIALLGSRKVGEASKIVENLGGTPFSRPAQGTVFLDESKLKDHLIHLIEGKFDWIIFTTGIGVENLYNTAMKLQLGEKLISVLQNMNIAARGYKTVNMLKMLGLAPIVRDDDGSTSGLVSSLSAFPIENRKVSLQLHGEPAPVLSKWLNEQSVEFEEILPYVHISPDEKTLQQLLMESIEGEIDAVVFTSTLQVRNLMNFAREMRAEKELKEAFSKNMIALAVGKVTAQALYNEGIERVIFPQVERIGSAIVELANYYQQHSRI